MKQAALRFVEQKADPNYLDKTGLNVLYYAADRADDVFITKLLEARGNPNIHNQDMECAVFKAAYARNIDVLSIFLLPTFNPVVEGNQAAKEKASENLVRNMNSLSGAETKELIRMQANPNFK